MEFDTLHISGVPPGINDAFLQEAFGCYTPLLAYKILDEKHRYSVLLGVAKETSQWMVEKLNGSTPQGLAGPILCKTVPGHTGFHLMLAQIVREQQASGVPRPGGSYVKRVPDQAGWAIAGGEEKRKAPDGGQYTQAEFLQHYGNANAWDKAGGNVAPSAPAAAAAKDNLYVKDLPDGCSDAILWEVFGHYGTVTSVRVLPSTAGKSGSTGFVRMSTPEEARFCVDKISGVVPPGLEGPVIIKFAGEEARQDGDWTCENWKCGHVNFRRRALCNRCETPRPANLGPVPPIDNNTGKKIVNLYLQGLPLDFNEDGIRSLFGQFGVVSHAKVLPPARGKETAAGFCSMEEAGGLWCVENLDGCVPPGGFYSIQVAVADEAKRKGPVPSAMRPVPY